MEPDRRTLYTLAFPILAPEDRSFIDALRDRHDAAYRDVVAPHFTLVFGARGLAEATYRKHVGDIAQAASPISFVLRRAVLWEDHAAPILHVYLVPDEGHGALVRLHDRLYTGALAAHLRRDLPFTPHITVGRLDYRAKAGRLSDDLNRRGIAIAGRIDALTVAALEGDRIRDIAGFPLGGS